jgi:hypothetical protein
MISLFIMTLLIAASAHAAQVTLAWDASSGSAGYKLFARAEGQNYDYARPKWQGTVNGATLIQLEDGCNHYFVVRAFDSNGNESANSNEVKLDLASAGAPPRDTTPRPPDRPTAQTPANNAQNVDPETTLVANAFSTSFAGDYHAQTRWQIFRDQDQLCVFDIYGNNFLTRLDVPPLVLDGNTSYSWTARFVNQGGSISPASSSQRFTTAEWPGDTDGNGIPDSQEVTTSTDLDRDGRPDDQQPGMKRFQSAIGDQKFGIQVSASSATANLDAVQSIDVSSVSNPSNVQPRFPVGLYNFKINVNPPGGTVTARIHFANAVPARYHFYMFDPAVGYIDFGTRDDLAPNETTATFQLQDGGEGDLDGVENGVIVAIGGYGTAPTSANLSGGGSGGSGGCFIRSLLGH